MAAKKKPATILESLFNAQEELNVLKLKQQKDLESITAKVQELETEVFECFQSDLKKSEGTETIEQLGFYVKISRPVKYELKEDSYRELAKTLPEHLQFHRTKLELDKKEIFKFTHDGGRSGDKKIHIKNSGLCRNQTG